MPAISLRVLVSPQTSYCGPRVQRRLCMCTAGHEFGGGSLHHNTTTFFLFLSADGAKRAEPLAPKRATNSTSEAVASITPQLQACLAQRSASFYETAALMQQRTCVEITGMLYVRLVYTGSGIVPNIKNHTQLA